MRGSKAKGWKSIEDERKDEASDLGPSHSSPTDRGGTDLTTAALAAPLSADTTTSAAPLTISNPVIVNAFDTTAFGNPDPSGLAFIPGGTPGTGTLLVSDSEVDE